MHDLKCRAQKALALFFCLAVFCSFLTPVLPPAVAAASEETAVEAAVEMVLRNYQEEAMLYETRDLYAGTVAEPGLLFDQPDRTFPIAKEEKTLDQLRENFIYLEKKARFYAVMRQIQGIYRENLQLFYEFSSLEIEDDVAVASVTETASFRYTDSTLPSIYNTNYTVRLVKLDGRWLAADVTDGSRFDKYYKSQGAAFDEGAALSTFAANLEREDCVVSFPYTPSDAGGRILYNGANAAAYAYTYSSLAPGTPRAAFYNAQFTSYAGQGGDCMNFGSQCMWAGFGGSQTSAAISRHAFPMDISGDSQWFGRAAGGGKINYGWISCQSFRQYLTGNKEGTGSGGSNASSDMGMYATILDAGPAGALDGVTAEELVGAIAQVEGSGGSYSHTIVLTAADGTRRNQVYFCGHTKDITHVKLGDYYIWDIKVFIPRYLRTGGADVSQVETDRLLPVEAGTTGVLNARTSGVQEQITITVTPPNGAAERAGAARNATSCEAEYTFSEPGLYQVVCGAKASENANWVLTTYYVRCHAPLDNPGIESTPDAWEMWELSEITPEEEEVISDEMPDWLRPSEDSGEDEDSSVLFH